MRPIEPMSLCGEDATDLIDHHTEYIRFLSAIRRPTAMLSRSSLCAALLLALAVVLPARAHTIDLAAASRDCYFEDLHTEDKVRSNLRSEGPNRVLEAHHPARAADDRHVPGSRRRAPRRRLLGQSPLPPILPRALLLHLPPDTLR